MNTEDRIAFLRTRPIVTVEDELAPTCKCRTFILWRLDQLHPWRCYACDPPADLNSVEVIRAEIPGRPVWDAQQRRWTVNADARDRT
jgi:hypothetical protein